MMEQYADGDKTSCEEAKKVLIEALREKQKIYKDKAQQYYKDNDTLKYLQWDNKKLSVIAAMGDVSNIMCKDLVAFAEKYGIDLPAELTKKYAGDMDALEKQIRETGVGQLFTNLVGAAEMITEITQHTDRFLEKLYAYFDTMKYFTKDFIQTQENGWILPWYIDQEQGQAYASDYVNKGVSMPTNSRIPLIIEYENKVYEYFLWILEKWGKEALCRYIASLNKSGAEFTSASSIGFQVYIAQKFAFQRIDNYFEISQSCIGKTET